MLIKTYSAAVMGLEATTITLETNLAKGTYFKMSGMADTAVKESYDRIRAALPNIGFRIPVADLTINLSPADLKKEGSGFDLPMAVNAEVTEEKDVCSDDAFAIEAYLGKICDVSLNSFRYSVIRNEQIVGMYKNMVCFVKNDRYGYFNKDKSLGILIKGEKEYSGTNEIICGKCTVYTNKGTYFGGNTYAFSSIEKVSESGVEVHTGKFIT